MLQVGIFFHTFIVAKTTNIIIRPHAWYKQFNKQEKLKDTKGIEVRFQNETHSRVTAIAILKAITSKQLIWICGGEEAWLSVFAELII